MLVNYSRLLPDGTPRQFLGNVHINHALRLNRLPAFADAYISVRDSTMPESFFTAYVTTALWSSNDESDENTGGDPLDKNYDVTNIDPLSLLRMRSSCEIFWEQNKALLEEAFAADYPDRSREFDQYGGAGHDFWLNRNGHGAGFWDGDWGEYGDRLSDASKLFCEHNLYLGDPDDEGTRWIYLYYEGL